MPSCPLLTLNGAATLRGTRNRCIRGHAHAHGPSTRSVDGLPRSIPVFHSTWPLSRRGLLLGTVAPRGADRRLTEHRGCLRDLHGRRVEHSGHPARGPDRRVDISDTCLVSGRRANCLRAPRGRHPGVHAGGRDGSNRRLGPGLALAGPTTHSFPADRLAAVMQASRRIGAEQHRRRFDARPWGVSVESPTRVRLEG